MKRVKRLLVCGGRSFDDWGLLCRTLDQYAGPDTVIIHGGARGADALASRYAACGSMFGSAPLKEAVFKADWDRHGLGAGPIRNQKMLMEGQPEMVIAFPGDRGTADMVRRAEEAGVPVVKVSFP